MAALNTNPQRSNLNINFPTVNNDRYFANHPILTMIDHCSNPNHLKQIHGQMLRTGLFFDPYSASKLIQTAALSQFSSIEYARKAFDEIPNPNIYSWNALIRAYSSSPEPIHSFLMFLRLYCEGSESPNKFTYPFVIKALAELSKLQVGKGLHGMVIKSGFISDLYVLNSLIHFYVECGCLDMAYQVFSSMPKRDVVSWNSMINGFAQRDYADEALDLFQAMEGEDVKPNDVTMLGVLSACGKKLDFEFGRWVHSYIVKNGISMTLFLCNAILDMYTKCGSVEEAMRVFDEMEEKDVISWTTMLSGYARLGDFDAAKSLLAAMPCQSIAPWNALISAYEQNGKPKEALAIFNELQLSKKAKPDEVTLVSTLSACAQLGAIDLGGWIHVYIKKEGINLESHLITLLIDMYSKCGDLEKALDVFHSVDKRDAFAWSTMIGGLAMHGFGRDAIELFSKMKEAKIEPNSVTFTNLLSACSHSGLVEEGRVFFRQMELVYNVVPCERHYACMVDILGRAGHLKEAMEFIKNMPIAPSASVWSALLGACRLHSSVELAEHAWAHLLELEPQNHGAYVSLSNIYALAGKWDKVTELRKVMKSCGLKKEPGCSSIEVDGVVHEFVVGDSSHPLSSQIYSKLEEIAGRLKSVGYVPNKSQLLQLVEEECTQEHALHLHSERLAIAFGLLTVNPSRPIRIMKNLRVCEDCHSVTKLISELYGREIIIRDRYRFHHFKGGYCSCNDYW